MEFKFQNAYQTILRISNVKYGMQQGLPENDLH